MCLTYMTHDSVASDSSLHLNPQIILRVLFSPFIRYLRPKTLAVRPENRLPRFARYYFHHYITFNARHALYELQRRRRVNADNSQNKRQTSLSLKNKYVVSAREVVSISRSISEVRMCMYVCVSVCIDHRRYCLAESRIDSQSIAKYGFLSLFLLLAHALVLKIDSTSLDTIVNS